MPPVPEPKPTVVTITRRELARDLTISHAGAIVVGCIIGTGIFLVPSEMMQAVGSSGMVYIAWVVGGLLSFFGALTYAELGAMKPQAGGEYVYMRDGYGPLGGFLYAWTWFLIAKPGSIAAISVGLVRILGTFTVLSFLKRPAFGPVDYGQLVAMAAVVFISWVNYIGVKKAGEFQLAFTVLKILIVLAIVVAVFSHGHGTWSNLDSRFAGAPGGIHGFMVALVAALWAYDGWNVVTTVSAEVRNPQRNIPLALIFGVAMVAGLYMLANAAMQYVMPAAAIAASPRPASDATALAVGAWGAAAVSAGMALSLLATLNGSIMTGARVPFALARDGYFFTAVAKVHSRYATPSVAIVVQAVMAILLLLFAGTFQQLFSLTIFAEFLFYMLVAITIFIFRHREPNAERPYRTLGYPAVPALFIVTSAFLLYYTFAANVRNSAFGVLVILAGVPVYYAFASRQQR